MAPDDFDYAWSQGVPIVVSGVYMEASSPKYFIKHFPDMKVDLEDCETGMLLRKKPTVSEFLPDFGRSIDPTKTWKLKVQILVMGGFTRLTASQSRTGLLKPFSAQNLKACSMHS